MIPFGVDVPMKRLPWANWILILVTIAVSIAVPYARERAVSLPKPGADGHLNVVVHESELSPLVLQRRGFALYQLVTSLFQHAGLIHLFGNMLFLFVFGNAVNAKLGHAAFLASYLGIGALGSLIWLVMLPGEAILGASGAIVGMCGMFLVLYPRNGVRVFWDEFEYALITRSWTGELPGWGIVLLYMVFDVWGAIFQQHSGIAYISHLVGAVAGITLAIALLKLEWITPDRGEQTLLQCLAGEGPTEEDPDRPARRRTKKAVPGR